VISFTTLRLGAALLILVRPLGGFILSLLLDFLDGRVFILKLSLERHAYHRWDKIMDTATFISELAVVSRFGLFVPFFLLLLWRLMGTVLYFLKGNEDIFVVTPNLLEAAFLWFLLFYPGVGIWSVTQEQANGWMVCLLIGKLVHEYVLHTYWPRSGWRWWNAVVARLFARHKMIRTLCSSLEGLPRSK